MSDLAVLMKGIYEKNTGREIVIRYAQSDDVDYTTDNPSRRCPDITKAQTELSFNPNIALDDGLEKTLTWYGII